MKKIFAIALALVMVLSMASAFAWCPTGFSWDCSTTVCANGTGKVEVIPYVKGNGCGTGNTWSASTCAGAVNGDFVYAALKVTVDADANEDWWAKAALDLDTKGVKALKAAGIALKGQTGAHADDLGYTFAKGYVAKLIKAVPENEKELKAGEYYIVADKTDYWKAVPAADFVAGADTLFSATVVEAAKVKFCAELASELKVGKVEINNKYVVEFDAKAGTLTITDKKLGNVAVFNVVDEKIKTIKYNKETLVAFDGAAFLASDADSFGVSCEPWAWLYNAMTYFGIGFGTCINADTVNANLGWDNEVESCFSWNSDVQSVVNAECVVAIPKTGDASVLAWLF